MNLKNSYSENRKWISRINLESNYILQVCCNKLQRMTIMGCGGYAGIKASKQTVQPRRRSWKIDGFPYQLCIYVFGKRPQFKWKTEHKKKMESQYHDANRHILY